MVEHLTVVNWSSKGRRFDSSSADFLDSYSNSNIHVQITNQMNIHQDEDNDDLPNLSSFPKNPFFIPKNIPVDFYSNAALPSQFDYFKREFEHALLTGINIIPDVPFELSDYKPQNPVKVPDSYPQYPDLKLLQPEFMRMFDEMTLFYIFYFHQGTVQQFFAGRELKQRDWIFNKVNKTWYHRLSEPVEKTEKYEIAKFEYFDDGKDSWGFRTLGSFRIDYQNIED